MTLSFRQQALNRALKHVERLKISLSSLEKLSREGVKSHEISVLELGIMQLKEELRLGGIRILQYAIL